MQARKPVARGQHVPATQRYAARGDNLNKENFFQPFPGEAETEGPGNLENLWAVC